MVELRIAMMRARVTQIELARRCGLTRNQINAIVRELRAPSSDEKRAIAKVLEKPVRDLFPEPAKAA